MKVEKPMDGRQREDSAPLKGATNKENSLLQTLVVWLPQVSFESITSSLTSSIPIVTDLQRVHIISCVLSLLDSVR